MNAGRLIWAVPFLWLVAANPQLSAQQGGTNPGAAAQQTPSVVGTNVTQELALWLSKVTTKTTTTTGGEITITEDYRPNAVSADEFGVIKANASQGNPVAQYKLGRLFGWGGGGETNRSEALAWVQKAAVQGVPEAQYYVGLSIQEKDPAEALRWFRKAAELGYPDAQRTIGMRYETGDGVPEDKAEAAKWYRKAAEQGHREAQFSLGVCYARGDGVSEDAVEAVIWWRKAAEQGDLQAQRRLGLCYDVGALGVEQSTSEAVKWYHKAAEQGDAEAQRKMGRACNLGQGVTKDYAEAIRWWTKAAEKGDREAQLELGYGYQNGERTESSGVTFCGGFKKDMEQSAKWLKKAFVSYRVAAEDGDLEAQCWVALAYKNGDGVERDLGESAKWYRKVAESYRKSAEEGDARAQSSLALCYSLGQGVPKDESQALRWKRRAAEQGDSSGQFSLGMSYYFGDGAVPKDLVQAYMWFNLAASSANGKGLGAYWRDRITEEMSPDQIAEAQHMSRAFKPRKESSSEAIDGTTASGTGFFISEDGFLVTNEHVVRDAAQIRLVTSAGLISAKVVKVDGANDLALLKAEGKFAALAVMSSRAVKLGGTAATVGFPNIGLQGFAPKLAKGEIASLSGAGDDARYFQISVPVQPGNSGGALVDERGNVVGVVSAKLSARAALAASGSLPENVNYAVKSSFLLGFLESMPEVSAKLKEPNTKDRKFEDVVKSAEQAAVLVLVY